MDHNPGAASAWEEHKAIADFDSLKFGPNTYDASKAMVRAYINGDNYTLLNMAPGSVNMDVLWCLPGSAIMYPTITHAVMAVQFTEGCPEGHPNMFQIREMAEMITTLLRLGARREIKDTTGKTAWYYVAHFKPHSLIQDALQQRTPGSEPAAGCCTIQ